MDLFDIDKDTARHILATALSKGGDYADIFFEHTISNELSLRDGEVNIASSNIDFGAGIRVIAGDKTGYAFTEKVTRGELEKAALAASEISRSATPHNAVQIVNENAGTTNRYPILSSWDGHSVAEKKQFLLMLRDKILQKSDKVLNIIARIADSESNIMFYNSLGDHFTDVRPMAAIAAVVVMKDGSRMENFYSSKSFRMGFEFLTEELVEELAVDVTEGCLRLFEAERPPCGEMPVVMGSGSSGILLHEAIGHTFEADFNRKNVSIFSDKMGQRICIPEINIVDDGTLPFNRGSINFDDEGISGQKTYMVKDGILNSYLHDRISAKFYGAEPTGNGRRESFRYMPIPRMRATYMESGNSKEADLIASVKKGIYVDNFSNGEVQIGAGDFTFYVKSGYLIENGRLTRPIKDANIIGNGPTALADIVAVADNLSVDNSTWTCGKGQYCPVSCGMPSVLVKKLNVGGINE